MIPRLARRLLLRLAALLAGLLVALLVGELAVRWLHPQAVRLITPGLYVADPPGGYRLQPGYRGTITNRTEFATAVSINSAGLRGPEPAAPGAACRILVTGDSYTFGIGVEDDETYPYRLGELLRAGGADAEVVNGGLPGLVGLPDEVRWLERHGMALEPDLVIFGVFAGNDLQEATRELGGFEVVDGLLAPAGTGDWGLKEWLFTHSQLYILAKSSLPNRLQRRLRGLAGLEEPWSQRLFRKGFAIYAEEPSELVAEGLAASDAALGRLEELAGERGFAVAAMLIPDPVQIDPLRWRSALEQIDADAVAYDPDAPTRRFRLLFDRRGIPTLDLTEALRRMAAAGRYDEFIYPQDTHWTPAGNSLAAELLAGFLIAEDLVCPETPGGEPRPGGTGPAEAVRSQEPPPARARAAGAG